MTKILALTAQKLKMCNENRVIIGNMGHEERSPPPFPIDLLFGTPQPWHILGPRAPIKNPLSHKR